MPTRLRRKAVAGDKDVRVWAKEVEMTVADISGSREQVKSSRGSTRGARTASARGQHREQERRAA